MEDRTDIVEESNELYEHHRFVADPGQKPLRIDKFLFDHIAHVSRNKIQNTAKAGNVLVNEKSVKSNYRVRPNDVVSVVLSHPPRDVEIFPQEIPLDIVYEDDDLMVINKQAGLVVHPGHGNYDGTLLNGLAFYFKESGQTNIENGFGYLVHRIDKNTTGLLLVAKNEDAQTKLAELQNHDVDIVLAYYSQREFVEAQMSETVTATFIPVAQDGTQEVSQADASYQQSLTDEDSVLNYLKTIHRTLKSQS